MLWAISTLNFYLFSISTVGHRLPKVPSSPQSLSSLHFITLVIFLTNNINNLDIILYAIADAIKMQF